MKLHIANDLKNRGLLPPISYNPYQTTRKTPTDKSDSPKVETKTQYGEKDIETVAI